MKKSVIRDCTRCSTLLISNHKQEKTARLEENAGRVGLKLKPQKCKWMNANSRNNERLRVRESMVEEVDSFTAQVTKRSNIGHQEEDSTGVCKF